jgi:hypothetical protein
MIFQIDNPLLFTIWVIIAALIMTLILFLVVYLIVSKEKALSKKVLIIVLAIITVLLLPFIRNVVILLLTAVGDILAMIRNAVDGGGQNYLLTLVPIIGFIVLVILTKYLLDVPWDKAAGVSLVTLIILYVIYSIIPELYLFLEIG